MLAEERVPVITTGAGSPGRYMQAWKEAGIKVLPVVASTAFAKLAERAGADAVIAEGCESGGHIGELTTMALVPQVVDAVRIPVVAAGGIADGRGLAASLALGACGVQMGTRFLVAKECRVSEEYKKKDPRSQRYFHRRHGQAAGSSRARHQDGVHRPLCAGGVGRELFRPGAGRAGRGQSSPRRGGGRRRARLFSRGGRSRAWSAANRRRRRSWARS